MSHAVVYRSVARREFDDAVDYYEEQRGGLGARFADAVRDTIHRISHHPFIHAVAHKDIRKAVVFGFPYVVYYRAESTQVTVIAVFHGKRNPRIWKSRK
jgi:plasmid stabilization system protein ParE